MKKRLLIPTSLVALFGALLVHAAGVAQLAQGVFVCVKANRGGNPVTGSSIVSGDLLLKDGTRTELSYDVQLSRIEGSNGVGCTERIVPDRDLLRDLSDVGEGRLAMA